MNLFNVLYFLFFISLSFGMNEKKNLYLGKNLEENLGLTYDMPKLKFFWNNQLKDALINKLNAEGESTLVKYIEEFVNNKINEEQETLLTAEKNTLFIFKLLFHPDKCKTYTGDTRLPKKFWDYILIFLDPKNLVNSKKAFNYRSVEDIKNFLINLIKESTSLTEYQNGDSKYS